MRKACGRERIRSALDLFLELLDLLLQVLVHLDLFFYFITGVFDSGIVFIAELFL